MKKFALLMMLVYPVLTWAQADDVYFVPKKEKTVLVVKSAEEVYFVDDDALVEDVYETDYVDTYYTDNLYEVIDDYTYSNRIIRFRSPRRLLSSNLFWDWRFEYGMNDWYIYDNGYTINIYPTYSNPYYYSYSYNNYWWNRWNWNSYYGWYDPHYPHHDWWHCGYNNWHAHHWHWHGHGHGPRFS